MRRLPAFLLLALAFPLAADPLADVRGALGRMTGRDAIRATYEVQQVIANSGRFNNDNFSGKAAVELEGDANGLRVVFTRALLDQMNREEHAKARNPKQQTPTMSVIEGVTPDTAAEAIDYAAPLTQLIDGAKVVEDKQGAWQGKPARVVVLRLADRHEMSFGKVTVAENKLTLWLAQDHVPMAAEHVRSAKFSFLIFKGEGRSKRSWTFARVGDRLVPVRHESSESGSGMGQKGSESLVATVKVHV